MGNAVRTSAPMDLMVCLCLGLLFCSPRTQAEPVVSLTIHQAPVAAVLSQLANQAALNVVLAEPIETPISVQIENMPASSALALISELAGLEMKMRSGVPVVASGSYWQAVRDREPMRRAAIAFQHRDAQQALPLLAMAVSGRGEVLLDAPANRVWVHARDEEVNALIEMAQSLDRPVQQVLIESRIVVANRDFNKALGLRFAVNRPSTDPMSGSIARAVSDVSIGEARGQLSVSLLSARSRLDAELSAMEASGQGRVISTPRLMVANRAEAFIQQGVAVPFEAVQSGEGGTGGAVSVQFREAVLALKATPLILDNGQVQLDLNITQDTVGQIFQTGRGGSVPSIDTRQLGTQVLVQDGQTLVLGGIFQEQDGRLSTAVPGLSQLPGLGRLFQSTRLDDQRRELLIFITPIVQR